MSTQSESTTQRRATRATTFLWVAAGGVASTFAGLAADARMHSQDGDLAAREGVFTLSNPGHLLLAVGIALVTVGVGGAILASLREGAGSTRRLPVGIAVAAAAVAVLASGAVVQAAGTSPTDHHELQAASATEAVDGHTAGDLGDTSTLGGAPAIGSMADGMDEGMDDEGGHAGATMRRADTSFLGASERAALADFVGDAEAGAMQYASLDDAAAAGYRIEELTSPDVAPGRKVAARMGRIYHVSNPNFAADGRVVEPAAPETLLYYEPVGGEPVLAGALFRTERGGTGPEATVIPEQLWHTHAKCVDPEQRSLVDADEMTGECPAGSISRREPAWMTHVWFLDDLDAAFARRPMDVLAGQHAAAR